VTKGVLAALGVALLLFTACLITTVFVLEPFTLFGFSALFLTVNLYVGSASPPPPCFLP
jgi:hypothetical protein